MLLKICCMLLALCWATASFARASSICRGELLPVARLHAKVGRLDSVSGSSQADVWAVGGIDEDGIGSPLTEHFDGTSWQIVRAPNDPKRKDDTLLSVSTFSPTDAWAVGAMRYVCCGPTLSFAIHWNGVAWAEVPILQTGAEYLSGVAVNPANADDVWAVGDWIAEYKGQHNQIYADHWDGHTWTSFPLPHLLWYPAVSGVSIAPDGEAWIVGADFGPGNLYSILHWNGSAWSPQASKNSHDHFTAVSAPAPNDVWAAGALIEHFDGSSWSVSLDPKQLGLTTIDAISGLTSDNVWAVGDRGAIIHWDGQRWSDVWGPRLEQGALTGVQTFDDGALAAGWSLVSQPSAFSERAVCF